jgi:prepilin-type N-terminal cleavage/methylation domain-containing protein
MSGPLTAHKSKFRMREAQRGFTLLETVIAMLILAGGIMVVANAWSGNLLRLEKARINNTMGLLLQRKITELEIFYQGKANEEIKDEDAGDFGVDYPQYKWAMKSQEFEMPDLSGTLTARQGGANEMLLTIVKQMSEYFRKAVKEVTVSVIYQGKNQKKSITNDATTYFVDYKVDLPMFGGGGGASTPGGAAGGTGGANPKGGSK